MIGGYLVLAASKVTFFPFLRKYFILPFVKPISYDQTSPFFKSISEAWFLIHCFRTGINQLIGN